MTHDTTYSLSGADIQQDDYSSTDGSYVEDTPMPAEPEEDGPMTIGRIRLKKAKVRTSQRGRDYDAAWLRNLREE